MPPTIQCERWLRNIIIQYKYLFPSFHVPKNSLREVPHQSMKKFLHNFQSCEETMWDPAFELDSVPCPCSKYRNKLPDRCFSSGHVAAGLEDFEALLPGVRAQCCEHVVTTGCPSPELCLISGSRDTGFRQPYIRCFKSFAKNSGTSMSSRWSNLPD